MLALICSLCFLLTVSAVRPLPQLASIAYQGKDYYREYPSNLKPSIIKSPFNATFVGSTQGLQTVNLRGKWVVVNQWRQRSGKCIGAPQYTWAYKVDQLRTSRATAICEPYFRRATFLQPSSSATGDRLIVNCFRNNMCTQSPTDFFNLVVPRVGEGNCTIVGLNRIPSTVRYVNNV